MRNVLIAAGLLAAPACRAINLNAPGRISHNDPRLTRVRQFFDRCKSPLGQFAEDFISAADENEIDWRILPSISLIESSAGKKYAYNNIFGWDQTARFPSIRAAIHAVASRLGKSRLYRNKPIPEMLKTYNSKPGYRECVESVMRRLGPVTTTHRYAAVN